MYSNSDKAHDLALKVKCVYECPKLIQWEGKLPTIDPCYYTIFACDFDFWPNVLST